MKLAPNPHKAKASAGSSHIEDAWWYDNRNSIDVLVQITEGFTVGVRINRSALLAYIERSKP